MLADRFIVLGVTGGIAAYKSLEILRLLRREGAETAVVMTESARRFVAPLSFQTLSGRPVAEDLFTLGADSEMEHLSLAHRADLVLVAPATANTLARMAAGFADNLLTTLLLATEAPVVVAPAMNSRMLAHPATEANLRTLRDRGVHVIPPGTGRLAAEASGPGRLADPAGIVARVRDLLLPRRDLARVRVLVTAGPTREHLDLVRYISNRSSGKMGYAVAARALARGAAVTLVSGPVQLDPPPGAHTVPVTSAEEMRAAVFAHLEASDVVVMTAAVADFRPASPQGGKIRKKGKAGLSVKLEATPDILSELGERRGERILVGFAAEPGDPAGARGKLDAKGLDLLVANDVTLPGAGFDSDTNQVEIFTADGRRIPVPMQAKTEVADRILDQVAALLRPGDDAGADEEEEET